MKNASDTFTLEYLNYSGLKFRYYNYDSVTGCYDIHLSGARKIKSAFDMWASGDKRKNSAFRIWVSDDDGKGRDIDTLHYHETGKRLCTKWVHIYLSSTSVTLK